MLLACSVWPPSFEGPVRPRSSGDRSRSPEHRWALDLSLAPARVLILHRAGGEQPQVPSQAPLVPLTLMPPSPALVTPRASAHMVFCAQNQLERRTHQVPRTDLQAVRASERPWCPGCGDSFTRVGVPSSCSPKWPVRREGALPTSQWGRWQEQRLLPELQAVPGPCTHLGARGRGSLAQRDGGTPRECKSLQAWIPITPDTVLTPHRMLRPRRGHRLLTPPTATHAGFRLGPGHTGGCRPPQPCRTWVARALSTV